MGMSTSCAAAAAAGLQGELELGVGEVCTPECARIRCQEACKPVCPEAHIPLDKEYACENDQDAPNAVVLQQWPKKPGVLEIHFKLPDHSAKVVEFNKTPLGLEFTRTAPIRLKRVLSGSQGHELGLAAGWRILKINGCDVSLADFETSYELLKKAIERLPAPQKNKVYGRRKQQSNHLSQDKAELRSPRSSALGGA
eukprot:TRINITY_DN14891_c0_g1_i2.p1 TRINITY_DN14891_c0_g1~~TRINITY_DN14891_c0_g1_i2.p1  ORF type:complete len:197 (+),score=35.35 TRINITY_DN14891_c0_g1_i2:26-616(+)